MQLDFFRTPARAPGVAPLVDRPRASRTDPVTSHEAARAIAASGELGRQQREVLAAVKRWPGLTSLELAERMGVDRALTGRRLPELAAEDSGPPLVKRGEPRKVAGRRHVTWFPA